MYILQQKRFNLNAAPDVILHFSMRGCEIARGCPAHELVAYTDSLGIYSNKYPTVITSFLRPAPKECRSPGFPHETVFSLSLAFFTLFTGSWFIHAQGGLRLFNEERLADGESALSLGGYLVSSRFWFESFQNWQSEFLAIASMVLFSIWLREVNSPESKEVATPHAENEE